MLTKKSIARTAATTAGLALVATGALAPAGAAENQGADRRQDGATAAAAKGENAGQRSQAEGRGAKGDEQRNTPTRGRSAGAPYGNAYGTSADEGGSDAGTEKSDNGLGEERGAGHTPVTVCHALGNGEFVEITFDENAYEKHLENHMKHMDDHQDYKVEEGAGCDEVTPSTTTDETLDTAPTEVVTETTTLTETRETVTPAQVLGAEAFRARTGAGPEAPAVRGAEAVVAGSAATPATGPMAGILPQTGAAPMALAAVAGLGLVGAGATMVARRRREV